MELEAFIQSNKALDIFELDRMITKIKMSGGTSEKNDFYKFGWYQWVYFRDTYVTLTGDNLAIGRYCGTSIDVGTALTANIMINNRQQVHIST